MSPPAAWLDASGAKYIRRTANRNDVHQIFGVVVVVVVVGGGGGGVKVWLELRRLPQILLVLVRRTIN